MGREKTGQSSADPSAGSNSKHDVNSKVMEQFINKSSRSSLAIHGIRFRFTDQQWDKIVSAAQDPSMMINFKLSKKNKGQSSADPSVGSNSKHGVNSEVMEQFINKSSRSSLAIDGIRFTDQQWDKIVSAAQDPSIMIKFK